MIWPIYAGVFSGIYVSGGIVASPSTHVALVGSLLAFLFCGLRSGLFWSLAFTTTYLVFAYLSSIDYPFPNVIEPSDIVVDHTLNWLIAFIAITYVVAIYESMHKGLTDERDRSHNKYLYMATHDSLTDLPNRVLFYEYLDQSIKTTLRNSGGFAVIYIDLNDFKPVNDTYGHEIGDQVLVEMGRRMREVCRDVDIVARLGGDEFAIVLDQVTSTAYCQRVMSQLPDILPRPIESSRGTIVVGVSTGISIYPEDGNSADTIMEAADRRMYEMKSTKTIATIKGIN